MEIEISKSQVDNTAKFKIDLIVWKCGILTVISPPMTCLK